MVERLDPLERELVVLVGGFQFSFLLTYFITMTLCLSCICFKNSFKIHLVVEIQGGHLRCVCDCSRMFRRKEVQP